MTELIGAYSAHRPACTGAGHVVGAYNPHLDESVCVCGTHWWRGNRRAWHARYLYDHAGQGARLLGYDVYRFDAPSEVTA